jgi:parallel beta-helix repeat protein
MLDVIVTWLYETGLELLFLMPIGIIGIWRWSVWLLRKIAGARYHALEPNGYAPTVSMIIPVYNEDREVFRRALESWAGEDPDEIIAVVDHSDEACIEEFREFQKRFPGARLIVTEKPGKRAALADGIEAATSEIVILVDSDTIWERDTLPKILAPFKDPKVGGVGTRQSVLEPKTVAQRLFDIHLDSRYFDEMRFLAATGDAVTCLSGRTAAYRRSAVLPQLDGLLNETFWGKPCISGDDKRLTHLVQAAGWSVRYQENARVFTPGAAEMGSFLKQRLRWTRNSWRADLRALWDGWAWKKPALAFHLLDRIVQPVTTLIAPIYFGIALYTRNWRDVVILLAWWLISRGVKIAPNIRRRRSSILMLPIYVVMTWYFALLKLFALFTLNEQGWITRWDKGRLGNVRKIRLVPAYSATCGVVVLLSFGMVRVDEVHQQFIDERRFFSAENHLPNYDWTRARESVLAPPTDIQAGAVNAGEGLTPYRLQSGDTRELVATKYGVEADAIIDAAGTWTTGNTVQLQMPFKDHVSFRQGLQIGKHPANISYLPEDNTIFVSGMGAVVDMPTLHQELADNGIIKYEGDGVYLLKANIFLGDHTTLLLEAPDLAWLKMKSDGDGYVSIESVGGSISIAGARVSSWDATADDYDHEYEDGRSFVLIRNARMDVVDAEMSYLGFSLDAAGGSGGVYGVSWRITNQERFGSELVNGFVQNSKFHHNYFGVYTFGATGMVFRDNEFYENVEYGFDPHDDSNNFIIEYNYAHDNGNHGMIVSKRCVNNVFRWNRSENNRLHGIMLDRQSNGNSVYGNVLIGNRDGVAIWDSHSNAVYGNRIVGNTRGVRLNRLSSDNVVQENEISETEQYGVYVYDEAMANQVANNDLGGNNVGVYLRAPANYVFGNAVTGSENGIYLTKEAHSSYVAENTLEDNETGVYLKTYANDFVFDNVFRSNGDNLRISHLWRLVAP